MLKVLFRVDDGPGIGAGHLMRCLALAEALYECGASVHVSTVCESVLHKEWQNFSASIHVEPREIGSSADRELTLALFKEIKADWLVVDGYGFDVAWLDTVAAACRVLCLDDLGVRDAAVRLVLNQNAGAEMRYAQAYRRCGRALLGLDWFLLRRALREVRHTPEPCRLLLTLGGDDPNNRVLALMQALLADGRDFLADVVSTAPEAGFLQAQFLAQSRPDRFILHRGPAPLPPLMQRAAVVVSGGGVTSLEAVNLGVASVIVILADNQEPGAQYLAGAGAARTVALGDGSLVEAARLALDVLHNDEARIGLGLRGHSLIDASGPARVAVAMGKRG